MIFQLVLLQGGVWEGGLSESRAEPLAWVLKRSAWPLQMVLQISPCDAGVRTRPPALGSPTTPLRRGVPETFGGLVEAGRRRNISCRNNGESCFLKKLPFKKRKRKKR
ncbi:unnamed protein product [Pipistrellus nathusii]|uniref:Uncharacterized protein n=1 Tax=Pipistrellus nathusii TaxID=59473 RepID=A0ABP0A775_PIPNA